jgi:MoxR-like ATPase
MKSGGVLFINELNRLPEGVQNVLLPAIDERKIMVPKLGVVHAHPNFTVIATQNPKEFVATSHLSEAILDRFELVVLDYQSESEEQAIVARTVSKTELVKAAVRLVRFTRSHERIRRGASVRAAQAVAELSQALAETLTPREAFFRAALLALPTRIELERDVDSEASPAEELKKLVQELAQEAWSGALEQGIEKKKS